MNIRHYLVIIAAGAATLVSAGRARAVDLVAPSFFGQPNTTYQEWDGFTVAAGPNTATALNNPYGTPNWFDKTAATDGAFTIGTPTGHIYSFSGTLNLEADITAPTLTAGAKTTLVLQAEVLGSTLDQTLFGVSYSGLSGSPVQPSQVTLVNEGSSGSGFGGSDYYYQVEWDGLTAAANYAVTYSASGSSSSQVSARVDTLTVVSGPAMNLTWSNAAGTGIWGQTGDANWNTPGVPYKDGENVTFDNSVVTINQAVNLTGAVAPGSVTVNNSAGVYTITGTGSITGATGLTKIGSGKLILGTVNTYTGPTIVNGGILELAATGSLPANDALTIAAGAQVTVDAGTGPLVLRSLNTAGTLDLKNNGLIVHNGNLATIVARVTSSTAAGDTSHLTTIAAIQNSSTNNGGPLYSSTFDGATGLNLTTTDVLVRYTYFGDANLDGRVDGSDYSLLDSGYSQHLTGWQNGDFNYDGVIDGSDYTLIDNAFNRQGTALPAALATSTALVAASVPEPTGLGIIILAMTTLLNRRHKPQPPAAPI